MGICFHAILVLGVLLVLEVLAALHEGGLVVVEAQVEAQVEWDQVVLELVH